jgi:copper chaperone NosL
MKRSTQIFLAIISLSLVAGFIFPIWDIELEAPQYPEGLGMQIWISSIQGDLQTINGLNHYIGMKEIIPDSIPELKYMQYILGGLIVIGFGAVLFRSNTIFYIWFLLFITAGIAGGVDFYLWEYDYGHDLDPRAAIKVPGMNYQPPLWGSKQLLNFTAHSYPHTGGWIIILAGAAALLLVISELKFKKTAEVVKVKKSGRPARKSVKKHVLAAVVFSAIVVSCSSGPIEIAYGKDECALCRMTIMDNRFGTELVNSKGKAYKFDSVECLVNYVNDNDVTDHKPYVTQFNVPEKLVSADNVQYLISEEIPSPMGENISAHPSGTDLTVYNNESIIFNWNELLIHFK